MLVTLQNASCSEAYDEAPIGAIPWWNMQILAKPATEHLSCGDSVTTDARQDISNHTILPERDKTDSVIC
jgi:hypothetical protein